MKKLLLILLTPILLLTSCSKSNVTPQTMEDVIVGKKWINDSDGFFLSNEGDFHFANQCYLSNPLGKWIIEDDLIKYRYYQNSQEITILYGQVAEYTSTQIKLIDSTEPNMTINTVYDAYVEVYGCTDSAADNYNEDANCDDGSCNYCMNNCTYVPDDNFEQQLIIIGLDDYLDDYVTTSSIDTVTILYVSMSNISDFTGIEAFTSLIEFHCGLNNFTSLDVSKNTSLTYLDCSFNQLTSLDLSQNISLTTLDCTNNQLTSLDVSNNTALKSLRCSYNQITSIDLSNNIHLETLFVGSPPFDFFPGPNGGNNITNLDLSNNNVLTHLNCNNNNLESLDIRNTILSPNNLLALNNPNLFCINVDDVTYANANWTFYLGIDSDTLNAIDSQMYFSVDCP